MLVISLFYLDTYRTRDSDVACTVLDYAYYPCSNRYGKKPSNIGACLSFPHIIMIREPASQTFEVKSNE